MQPRNRNRSRSKQRRRSSSRRRSVSVNKLASRIVRAEKASKQKKSTKRKMRRNPNFPPTEMSPMQITQRKIATLNAHGGTSSSTTTRHWQRLTPLQAAAVTQTTLPYCSKSIRLRVNNNTATAVARNHQYMDLDLSTYFYCKLVDAKSDGAIDLTAYLPVIPAGPGANYTPLYDTTASGLKRYTVAQFHDAYLLGVFPSYVPAPFNDQATYGHGNCYLSANFAGAEWTTTTFATINNGYSISAMSLPPNTPVLGSYFSIPFNPPSRGGVTVPIGPGPVILSPSYFYPSPFMTNIALDSTIAYSSKAYGEIHPCVCFSTGSRNYRAVWIDASGGANVGTTASTAGQAVVGASIFVPAGYGIANPESTGAAETTLRLVAMRLNYDGTVMLPPPDEGSGFFVPVPVSASTTYSAARINIGVSGYYVFALTGSIVAGTTATIPSPNPIMGVALSIRTSTAVVSRHFVNRNIPIPDVGSKAVVKQVQVSGTGCLIHNSTAKISTGGMIYAATWQSDQLWSEYFANPETLIEDTANTLSWSGDWSEGSYGFTKAPMGVMRDLVVHNSPSSFAYADCFVNPNSSGTNRLLGANLYSINPSVRGSVGDLATIPRVTLRFAVSYQYTSESQLASLNPSTMSGADMVALNTYIEDYGPPFSSNSLHLSTFLDDAMSRLRTASRSARPYTEPVIRALSAFQHPLSSLISSALSAFNNIGGEE